ncbi:unnamed protein product [Urochloa humidicola]
MSAFRIIVAALLKRTAKRASTDPAPAAALEGGGRAAMFSAIFKAISGRTGPNPKGPPFFVLKTSQVLLSAVVLREPPLFGERVRAKLRAAERELARAVRKRDDPAAIADLRLLVAFLAARDGRFDDALERYVEMERADPRPHYLAHIVCQFDGRQEEAGKCLATYDSVATGSSMDEQAALTTLTDELVVALALGGSLRAFDGERYPVEVSKVVSAAATRVDVALVSALRDKRTETEGGLISKSKQYVRCIDCASYLVQQ